MWIAEKQRRQTHPYAAYSNKDELLFLRNDWVHRGCQPCRITAANIEKFKNEFRQQRNFWATYGYYFKKTLYFFLSHKMIRVNSLYWGISMTDSFSPGSLDMISFLSVDEKLKIKPERHPSFPLRWRMVVMNQLYMFTKNKSVFSCVEIYQGFCFTLPYHSDCPNFPLLML